MRFMLVGTMTLSFAFAQEYAFAGGAPDLPLAKRNGVQSQSEVTRNLSELLDERWLHGFPMQDALRLPRSPETFDRAAIKLAGDKNGKLMNAIYLLGVSGDPRAFETLRCLFETGSPVDAATAGCRTRTTASEIISSAVFEVRSSVPRALGILIYQFNSHFRLSPGSEVERATRDRALEYLGKCASPSPKAWSHRIVWRTDRFNSGDESLDNAQLFADLTEQCIEGLALSGDEQAAAKLDTIRLHLDQHATESGYGADKLNLEKAGYATAIIDRKFFERFDHLIRRAIVRNKAVAMFGLDEVF